MGDTVLLHQKKTTTKPPYDPDPFTVTTVQGTQIAATRRGKVVTRNVDKWKILKKRPHHLDIDKHTKHDQTDDDDDDFDLPKPKPAPRPVTPPHHPQEEQEQEHEAPSGQPASPPAPPPGPPAPPAGPRGTPCRERWEVANGPWRKKQSSPGPRERKRRQGDARRRSKEQGNYWLRSRGTPEEGEED